MLLRNEFIVILIWTLTNLMKITLIIYWISTRGKQTIFLLVTFSIDLLKYVQHSSTNEFLNKLSSHMLLPSTSYLMLLPHTSTNQNNKYSPVPNNSPPTCLIIFGIFVGSPFLIWTTPLINFPGFVLQIFQRLLKRILLFAKM